MTAPDDGRADKTKPQKETTAKPNTKKNFIGAIPSKPPLTEQHSWWRDNEDQPPWTSLRQK